MDVSFQLYSARNFMPWSDVYKIVATLGYTQVEGFGGVYEDPAATRAMLEQNGLTMPSGHFFPISSFEDAFNTTLTTAKALGMKRIFCPAPEDLWRDGTDAVNWISLAKHLEGTCKKVNDAGLRFGWHNHHWEFMPLPGDENAMELLLEHAPSIEWEIDVAWVVRGGADPLAWIARYKDQITTAHVKDIAAEGTCADEDGWADVGHGTMDWKAIMEALRDIDVDLFVMEHDNPNDMTRFAKRSIETVRKL